MHALNRGHSGGAITLYDDCTLTQTTSLYLFAYLFACLQLDRGFLSGHGVQSTVLTEPQARAHTPHLSPAVAAVNN
jgi:hypothetical protein